MDSTKSKPTNSGRRDLSEQIKEVTKDSHVRAENTQLMLNYQKGQITLPQYKLLLCSLYEIYRALEDELDKNSGHPAVEPIYFPQELARLEPLERDLEYLFGPQWRKRVTVPAATVRYTERLREIGRCNPNLLVAHAYTRYLGDLSGGQVLGKITQKTMGLSNTEGVAFFSFPAVTSPHRFKQLYRSRMNSIELTEEERRKVLDEAVRAFEFNIEVFDDLQKMLSITEGASGDSGKGKAPTTPLTISRSAVAQFTLGVCAALVTVGMGVYAL
ncbi:heme oxygenase 1a [Colossoma macropomum]|uniref:heme oxygenase 1a n=1 Tax=Colossoma macropomum TaxID=42526 RepID=UPI001863F26C|nr:heme oxygenase 1a [Colossoma macropomum]